MVSKKLLSKWIYKMKIYRCYQDFFECIKSSGWPWGWQLPELWAMQNLLMLHSQDWKPTVAQGVHGSTWNWLMHSNQTKRPWKTVENKRFHCHRLSANSQKCNFTHHHLITHTNHNYNKIVKCDWLSTAPISALIGKFNRTVCVMPK